MAAPTPDRWAAIAPVLDAALDLVPERRATFIAERCGSDDDLRREVERMLAAAEQAGTFLEDSAPLFVSPLVRRIAREERWAPGDRLGAYRIEGELGQGGMAVVYLARDTRHDRLVALKVLDRELSFTLGGDRFARETAIAARLNHPHILPLFDSGLLDVGSGSVLYYAMPHVEGRSLRERLRDEPRLSIETAISLGCQIAGALGHAHEHGVVHRDIKPENVLLAGEHAFVADFGIALALDAAGGDRLTRTGLSLGTPAYMSPEQATTGRLDGRSDLYSLGCVVYEMLAGQPPFIGPSAQAILAQHAAQSVPSLRELRPAVPPALERVVMRALAKKPDDRFPTGGAFADALAAAPTAGVGRGAAAGALLTRAGVAIRRHRWPVAVLAAIAAGATAAAMALGHGAARGDTAAPDRVAVAVVPFNVSAADASLGYLREGVVDLLATRLGGTEILHPVESRALARAWRGMNGGDDLTEPQALALAGEMGAGRLIEGEVVGGRPRVTLSSALVDVRDRRPLARVTVEGPVDSINALLDRLAARLLATAAGEDQARTATLAGRPLPAVRAYLDGQVLDRRGLADSAAKRFEEAVRADSTFSLAAVRLVQTTPWPDVQDAARETAWRYRDRLSVPDRADLALTLGPRYPSPSSYREIVAAAEHYAQAAPDTPDAWYQFGMVLLEDGTLLGLPEAYARAAAAFARAAALDSTSVPILQALSNAATALGDTAAARTSLARLRRQQRDSSAQLDFDAAWFLAAATGDSQAVRRILRIDSITPVWGSGRPVAHGVAMMQLGLHQGLDLRDVDGVLDRALAAAATEAQRGDIRWNQGMLDAIRGRSTQRPTGLPVAPVSAQLGGPILGLLFADGDSAGFGAAGAALVRQIGSHRPDECCIPRFAAGQYALATNRLDLAERAAADLLTYHGPSADDDSAGATVISNAFGVILRAQIAARRGDPSAATRLGELDSLLTDPLDASWWLPALGNLVAARLHEARGERSAALVAIRRRMWGLVCPFFVVYHREEGRLAALAGDTTGAVRAYRRYLALRDDADPPLQPRVQEVRRALAALERGSAAP